MPHVRRTLAVLLLLLAAGCSGDNFRDVEDVRSTDPDRIEVFNNVDQHPNIALVCVHGVAFVTTTRDHTAIMRVPDLDARCPGGIAK